MSFITEVCRKNRVASLSLLAVISYLLLSSTPLLPSPQSFFRAEIDQCSTANFQWRGANEKIYPKSGAPITIIHKDYSEGLANHDISVLFARSPSEEFQVLVEIFTSHDLPRDNFDIAYTRDELIITSLIPKNSFMLSKPHCVVMNVHLLLPVSKPLNALALQFPAANVYFHESTWASAPSLDINIGKGHVVMDPNQRFHIERMKISVEQGDIFGKIMMTKALVLYLQEGIIDVKVGYSPFPTGATIEVTQQKGSQTISVEDHFYRTTTGTYVLTQGIMKLEYPQSFSGSYEAMVDSGALDFSGNSLDVLVQTKKGVEPSSLVARQGNGDATTRMQVTRGKLELTVEELKRSVKTIG